jgi:antitoxin ParD1/3/4
MSIVVQLPEPAQSFVEQQVTAGRFTSASEYIASLVEEARRQAARERVDQLLIQGLESGPGIELTPEYRQKRREELSRKYDRADKP